MRARARSVASTMLLLGACLVTSCQGKGHDRDGSATSEPPSPRARAAELALVAPLRAGADLDGFLVREILAVKGGVLRIECARGDAVAWLDVALADPEGALAPATAGKYAVFYTLRGAPPEDGERLAKKLAGILLANAAVPPPPGMLRFVPRAKEGMSL